MVAMKLASKEETLAREGYEQEDILRTARIHTDRLKEYVHSVVSANPNYFVQHNIKLFNLYLEQAYGYLKSSMEMKRNEQHPVSGTESAPEQADSPGDAGEPREAGSAEEGGVREEG